MLQSRCSDEKIVLTFGYGNRKDYESFLGYIEKYNVSCVIDVRLSPRAWTRKWYGDAIENLCHSKNIQYQSKKALGNTSGCSRWIPPVQQEANQALQEIADILEEGNILLLCSELDYVKCHRVEVAQKLQEIISASVKHLR
jgi:uncharacterized protein (DUF488 family)